MRSADSNILSVATVNGDTEVGWDEHELDNSDEVSIGKDVFATGTYSPLRFT